VAGSTSTSSLRRADDLDLELHRGPAPDRGSFALQIETGRRERGGAPPPDRGGPKRERVEEMPPPASSRGERGEV
jgi:hypothetical protein